MKIRESGMPNEKVWEGFFNPVKILETLGVSKKIGDVAEFGCGFGTFTIPAAKKISGKIYSIDMEPEMLEITKKKAKENKLDNVVTVQRDFITKGSSLDTNSVDYVMLFNILHGEESEDAYHNIKESAKMLAEAKKINQKYYKKSLSILDRSAKIIVLLLEATKWYPLLIKLGGMPKIVVNKLIRMQKVHLETIDRIFNLIPTLDPEIYANILSLIVKKMDPNPSLDVPKSS